MFTGLNERLLNKDDDEQYEQSGFNFEFERIFNNEYNSGRDSQKYFTDQCKSVEHLAQVFKTNLEKGLDENNKEDLEWREKQWGNNHLPPEEPNRLIDHIIDCFKDLTLRVLLIASIVSLIIGVLKEGIQSGWIEGTAIFAAVFIVVSISSYMNYDEKEQFLKLSRETKKKQVIVKRNGMEKEISSEGILVGDVLKLRIGDIICVDGFIIGNGKADMDESPVTGESDWMRKVNGFKTDGKKYECPFIFSGSQCQDGTGYMLVACVGRNTFEGRNEELMNVKAKSGGDGKEEDNDEDAELGPLQKQLQVLANQIGNFGYIMALVIGFLMIFKDFIMRFASGQQLFDNKTLDIVVNAFIIAVTVIVVAIPEGLPMAVTISLAYSVQKMKEENNLVKHLSKSETMGNVNNVCTDKTGTLTEGEMHVIKVYISENDFDVDGDPIKDDFKTLICESMWSNITVVESIGADGKATLNGDMTEKAIYKFLKKKGKPSSRGDQKAEYVLPFKSDYKYMMSAYKNSNGSYTLYVKGAPERVSEFFTRFYTENEEKTFEECKETLFNQQMDYANDSIRTLVFGVKDITVQDIENARKKDPEQGLLFFQTLANDLTFQFMIGIRDNNRKDVPGAILSCKKAGITVRMVTGDNINTALAISKAVGIIEPDQVESARAIAKKYREKIQLTKEKFTFQELMKIKNITKEESPIALEGEVFREVCGGYEKETDEKGETSFKLRNKSDFTHIVRKLKVIARASPEDKFLLVFGLKQLGNIVAVTGDGTNDAPALKQAHVGFAMGIRGTDIAKNAADIVLLDDSFSSIVTACKYGRNVYDCIRKFVQFQLTTNVVAVFMTLLGGVILKDSPLNAIEMLWVNLIMDSFASLALATESPSDELLNRKPYSKDASIITPMMFMNIISQAIFQIVTLSIIIFYGDIIFHVPSDRELEHFTWNDQVGYHFTIFFNIFVFMQVFNSINARKLRKTEYNVLSGIFGNWFYIGIQSFIIVGQMILVTFGGRAVRTHALSITQHLECLGIASLTLVVGFFVKLIPIDTSEPVSYGEDQEVPKEKPQVLNAFGYGTRRGLRTTIPMKK